MAEKNSFIVRLEIMEQLEMLNNEQIGGLFMAMCRYVRDGETPAFDDPMLKMMFSFVRAQLDRDAEKYEETCKARSEAGKRGGRPKKANGFFEKAKKANGFSEKQTKAKKADSECVCECDSERECEPEPVPDCDPVCVPVCECDPECAVAQDTAHTHASISVENVLKLAEQFGYQWSRQEAADFLAYNLGKGRTDDWEWAVQKWEKNRPKHASGASRRNRAENGTTPEEPAGLDAYLSLANRFTEDGGFPNG